MKTISVSVANYFLEIAKTTKIIQLQIVWRLSVKVMTAFGLTDKLSSSLTPVGDTMCGSCEFEAPTLKTAQRSLNWKLSLLMRVKLIFITFVHLW